MTDTVTDPNKEIETLKAELEATKAKLAAKPAPSKAPSKAPSRVPSPAALAARARRASGDIVSKARGEIARADRTASTTKQLENALKFNLEVESFVKANKSLLPAEVEKIIEVANRETYDSAVDKTNSIKVGLMTSFFNQQANLDVLTPSQRAQVEDFQKLSKKGKEMKAAALYENVFEPALEVFKRIKKAEEVVKARSGIVSGSSTEDAYKQKMINFSRKAYLKETNV